MKCNCEKWIENIDKINGPMVFIQTTRPYLFTGPSDPFQFCPWCGVSLSTEQANAADEKGCTCGTLLQCT